MLQVTSLARYGGGKRGWGGGKRGWGGGKRGWEGEWREEGRGLLVEVEAEVDVMEEEVV